MCISENEVPINKTNDEHCNEEGLIFWPDNGLCYSLLTQGPCPQGHWLQLFNGTTGTARCTPVPCGDPDSEVFWPEICTCISANTTREGGYGPEDVCGPGSQLIWSPYGEGVCTCADHHYADEDGNCFEIGSVGPCKNGDIWAIVNGSTTCIGNDNEIRVFDLIPANNPNSLPSSRTTQVQRCHVDEKGKCRKTLNLKNRFGDSDNFLSWISGFKKRSSANCQVRNCSGDSLLWLDGKCYQLASTGPCMEGSWLVLDSIADGQQPIMKCKNKKCNDGIWWPKTCSCIKEPVLLKAQHIHLSNKQNLVNPCDEDEQILVDPYGDGVCGCKDNFVRDAAGKCYELGKQGPCQDYEVFSMEDGLTLCIDSANISNRIFDLIPMNEDPSSRSGLREGKVSRTNCHIDEMGKCRKVLNLRGRIDIDNEVESDVEDLINWLDTFEKQSDNCESPITCEDDKLMWEDGNCYHLATTGPCTNGEWLVLDEIVDGIPVIKCKPQKCPNGVWWSESCSCVIQTTIKSVDAIDVHTPSAPCDSNEDILINPYGDGMCTCKDMFIRHSDGKCYETGTIGPCVENSTYVWDGSQGVCTNADDDVPRIFDLIPVNNPAERSAPNTGRVTRQNCHVDELGKCRKSLNLRNRIDEKESDMVDWLIQFTKTDEKCKDKLTAEDKRKSECHRQGKVLFEDGECYNLLERGPCFENSMWLVMSEENGIMVPRCKDRTCLSTSGTFVPGHCQCYHRKVPDVCGLNEQLYDDIFGQGVCGCSPGHAVWDEDDTCHPVYQQGPCQENEVFVIEHNGQTKCLKRNCTEGFVEVDDEEEPRCLKIGDKDPCQADYEVGINPVTLRAGCVKLEQRKEKIFDLIPANENQAHNHGNSNTNITKETCVLDKRGKCRRKLHLKREAHKSEAQLFEEWLYSFQVRSPTKFQC